MFLFKLGVSLLISKLSLISKENLEEVFARTENSSKEGSLSQNNRWSRIALSFEGLHFLKVRFLKDIFLKNGYLSGFIDPCLKKVIDNVLTESPLKLTVEKCLLILPVPFLRDISLQLRTKPRKSFKNILNCCKVQIVFKAKEDCQANFVLRNHSLMT